MLVPEGVDIYNVLDRQEEVASYFAQVSCLNPNVSILHRLLL